MWQHGCVRAYDVLTEAYQTSGDGSILGLDPAEYGSDYRLVYARNARRAKVLALRAWRRANQRRGRYARYRSLRSPYLEDNQSDGLPPWSGVIVHRVDEREVGQVKRSRDTKGGHANGLE